VFRRTDIGVDVAAAEGAADGIGDPRLVVQGGPVLGAERALTALTVRGITNAVVELDSAELPVYDGTAKNFLFLIDCAGSIEQEGHAAAKQDELSDSSDEDFCPAPSASAHIFHGEASGHHCGAMAGTARASANYSRMQ
jgi:hypothetical protein